MDSAKFDAHSRPSTRKLLPFVVQLAPNWYELGAMLLQEEQEAHLILIQTTHGSDARKCCLAMLQYWMSTNPEATWHQLVTALRSPGINLAVVASDIEKNFTVEQSYKSVDNSTVVNFADFTNVADAFVKLLSIFTEELQDAKFETIRTVCLTRAKRKLQDEIGKTTNIRSLLKLLACNPFYFNWMNVEYLQTMAVASGNKKLTDLLKSYNDTVLSKTLGEIWNSIPSFHKVKTKFYSTVKARFDGKDPDGIIVRDLKKYEPKFAKKIALHIMQIGKGSLTFTWCILAEEAYLAYLLALSVPQEFREDDYLQIGTWVAYEPQFVIQELKKVYAMMSTTTLLIGYYHGLLLRSIDADMLTDKMCSVGLLTAHEQIIISSGHSVYQKNQLLLYHVQHMNVQALLTFCELVQEIWPQIGSQLITVLKYRDESVSDRPHIDTLEVTQDDVKVADSDATSSIDLLFFYLIEEINKLLQTYKLEIVELCDNLKASEIHNINLFSADQIKDLSECDSMLIKISPLFSWNSHSLLKALAKCCSEAVKLLDEFESKLDPLQPVTSYPTPCLYSNMIPSDTSIYTILAVRCDKELYQCTLQYVYDVQSVMIEKCDITQHCLQLLAVRSDPTILYWTIPKCVVDLINTNVPLHSEYLYSRGILEVAVYPDLWHTTGDAICYGSLTFECENQSYSEKIADLAANNQRNETMLNHVRSKYNHLLNKYEEIESYTAILESTLKEKEKDIPNDEKSQTTQENQSTIREVTDKEKLYVELTLELELLKKQKHNEELNKEIMDLKITINKLREEVNSKDSSIKVEQLQKQIKDLQYLVNKLRKSEHTASTHTQTDEVESDLEFELAKKQKHNEELNKENTDLRLTINLLREEVNKKDSSIKSSNIKAEQLQKQNANLQYLVNKYRKLQLEHTETTSTSTQTDEKQRKILCPGMKGVVVTCNGMEKSCAVEACKLLSEFADRLYVPEVHSYASNATDDTTLESDAAASQELKELNEKPFQKRFQSVECGAGNVVFIQCQEASICPSDLIHYMLTNIKTSGIPSTKYKYSLCMLPVTHTCRAFQNDVIKCAKEVLAPYFHIPDKTLQFAVVYKSRNNSGLIKDDVISWMVETANKGTTYNHKVNLKSPDLVILVEIIKSVCCMSVVTDFYKLKKYNIQELTTSAAKQEN